MGNGIHFHETWRFNEAYSRGNGKIMGKSTINGGNT